MLGAQHPVKQKKRSWEYIWCPMDDMDMDDDEEDDDDDDVEIGLK